MSPNTPIADGQPLVVRGGSKYCTTVSVMFAAYRCDVWPRYNGSDAGFRTRLPGRVPVRA